MASEDTAKIQQKMMEENKIKELKLKYILQRTKKNVTLINRQEEQK